MKSVAVIKRPLARLGAVMLAVTALAILPVANASAEYIRIFVSADHKIALVCHYSDSHVLRYCNVMS